MRARSARSFAIKWPAAPHAGPLLGGGPIRSAPCLFFPRKKRHRCLRHRPGAPLHGMAWVALGAWCFGVSVASPLLCQPKNAPALHARGATGISGNPRTHVHTRAARHGTQRQTRDGSYDQGGTKGSACYRGMVLPLV